MQETKYDRFRRLAKKRGERTLKDIQLLGNLSDTNNYDFKTADINKLFGPIEEEIRIAKARFNFKKKREINL